MAQAFKSGFYLLDEPCPNPLPEGWAKPLIYKLGETWVCKVHGWLYHGQPVVIQGRHCDLKWAWALMVDHLVRHDVQATCPQVPQ